MSGGGGRGGRGLQQALDKQSKALSSLRSEIQEDQTISDITREEVLGSISSTESRSFNQKKFNKELASAREKLEEARLGQDPKFIARQQRSTQRRLLADQPGRGQTILNR